MQRRSQLPPGNLIEPGATVLTRIPSGASSSARIFAIEMSADLVLL